MRPAPTIFVGSAIVEVYLNSLWQLELAIRHGQVADKTKIKLIQLTTLQSLQLEFRHRGQNLDYLILFDSLENRPDLSRGRQTHSSICDHDEEPLLTIYP